MEKTLLKYLWIGLGFFSLEIGVVGAVLPVLPSFPFFMMTLFCFTRSSERLRNWFLNTELYKKNLESYVESRAMTRRTKCRIMATVTAVMAFGFFMMSRVPAARVILCIVWTGHVLYFIFGIRTMEEPEEQRLARVKEKRRKEQRVVSGMILLYCRKHHKGYGGDTLCPACRELLDYSLARSERCPFMEHKTFCVNCKVHCYKPRMREEIRQVMRFSGPRMLVYHPLLAVWHLVCSMRERQRQEKLEV